MHKIAESRCTGLLFFSVSGYIKNCFCFHYSKYQVTEGDIKQLVDQTRREWISYEWEGECPLYSDPIGFKNHLETLGWKPLSTVDEPYLIDSEIANQLMYNYQQFLTIKAQRGL